ncbi:phage portal protein [Rhodococcus sp. KRD162]|uniref:phage portal protein n=1 Tax=Rhodococcus sp. KRD162 TaxID=2729725 RepID=UPI0027DBD6FB|nr:phage portal protein [Rhodococcus sp. KRD162]
MTAPILRTTLSSDHRDLIGKMNASLSRLQPADRLHDLYFEGDQRVKQLGIAVPPELRMFETIANWPRMYVEEIARRQRIKSLIRRDSKAEAVIDEEGNELAPRVSRKDVALQESFDVNNLASEIRLLNKETMIYGRCYMTVGTNEDDPDHPLISVESPLQMSCLIDQRRRRMSAAFRQFRTEDGDRVGTLFLPDQTIQVIAGPRGWQYDEVGGDAENEDDTDAVDQHELGVIPVVLFLNRRRLGKWTGTTEMKDIMGLTDACARTLANMQVAQETHGTPGKWLLGATKGDFVDEEGQPIPVWESYFTAMAATAKGPKDAAFGQFSASDLRNFHDTVKLYAGLGSSVTGLPMRYFGQNTANPAAEGAIRADESRINGNADEKNESQGTGIGWAMALEERFRTGEWPDKGTAIKVEWIDPGTSTKAEEADHIQKLNGGTPVYSREGSWDELGWDENRKNRERRYFAAESDPVLDRLNRQLTEVPKRTPGDIDDSGTGS